ncbi:sterol desaturase family protein [Methylomonas sp. SURF-2]|uniref:Sterol desaturase family protein n=1 Tax=Methylomonas subterranea TaxID=2952225 RepID=A0ABT1TIH5_9GAMM|nr:sterol desaturase family protein [Methylomonas sp. SURF-2]MCQ8105268.1 sterol desaturase family protein [Methylomonas sp. SURF-2]
MPTPIELLLDPVSLTLFALYALLMLWEALRPARALPVVRGWRRRGIAAFIGYWLLSSYLPLMWSDWLSSRQLFDLTRLGDAGGALAGLFLYEFGVYAWHRAMHGSRPLWRGFHQWHHSAERLDSYGAFWFSPLDMLGWTVLASLILTWLVGITPLAATWVLYATTFCSVFQHTNVNTPRWLGYLLQRPESHSVHHQRGVHAGNYADLPLFDIVFGTFRNPAEFAGQTGFDPGASDRVWDMLMMRDVSRLSAQDGGGGSR